MLPLSQGFNLITQYERFDLIDVNTDQCYSNLVGATFEFALLDNSRILEFAQCYKYNRAQDR